MTQASLPRITARIDVATQELLLNAAALVGISSLNSFVLNAAIEKANAILREEKMTQFNDEDTRLLLHYLDNPPEPNAHLRSLFLDEQR
ncbi:MULTISPECIES: DUF1778 domain-containing protein [Glaesserella]|uniref:DUF1778 domain-containing protein n=1 Tax=Glaesserella australis TaxID=2094024 RepID=A0A328BVG3_9PAST|nr:MULTISPECIES: DUF1778 domain-containing protein [Glaesserella]AUI65972.1 hypothetical protein CJD39_05010 [Glaesserella sp. 15-184]RAL18308.1 DUF1778 domain-containing protein [Glaesserella australis]